MKEKVVEILIYIMNEIQQDKALSEIDLSDLESRGFTQSEISAAFGWLYENFNLREGKPALADKPAAGSRRFLHDEEKFVLTTDCQGYLIQLRELNLLDDNDLETVIERAMISGFEALTIAELRPIVASVLFARGRSQHGSGKSLLDNKDTIH